MAAVELHWQAKSVVAHLATVMAADSMHDFAQLGTASALFWQGDDESQAWTPPM